MLGELEDLRVVRGSGASDAESGLRDGCWVGTAAGTGRVPSAVENVEKSLTFVSMLGSHKNTLGGHIWGKKAHGGEAVAGEDDALGGADTADDDVARSHQPHRGQPLWRGGASLSPRLRGGRPPHPQPRPKPHPEASLDPPRSQPTIKRSE